MSFIRYLFLKQPKHNTDTEKTKTINYFTIREYTRYKGNIRKVTRQRNKHYFFIAYLTSDQTILPCDVYYWNFVCAFDKKWVDMEFHTSTFYGNFFFQNFLFWIISTCKKTNNQENWQPSNCRTKITFLPHLENCGSVYYYYFFNLDVF